MKEHTICSNLLFTDGKGPFVLTAFVFDLALRHIKGMLGSAANPPETPRSSFLVAATDLESSNSFKNAQRELVPGPRLSIFGKRYFFSPGVTPKMKAMKLTTSTECISCIEGEPPI
ncbi:hypothetical protein CEXT_438201 [Caerostris extrusa]|uniref:Uncharacterized protein n=1 Tax=Caerostris extrusa TaxID=172846 RepID=A0AAV4Y9C8_CAEEX|nr:hypothetical protein CEXT_438201 [Caerostris extrusa]